MVKYGLIPEFVGRLPVLATLNDLDEKALVEILTTPKNALIKQYQKLFEMENVNLEFKNDALISIAKRAIQRKTGARGLRAILEEILLDLMFDVPGMKDLKEVVVSKDTVEKKKDPLLVFETKGKKAVKKSKAG